VKSIFLIVDNSEREFDVEAAQNLYERCFIPLLYHELWENIKHDIKSMRTFKDLFSTHSDIEIQITGYEPLVTQPTHPSELSIPTTLIFGSYSFQIDLSFTRTIPKLGLCDIVLININPQHGYPSFFAIVVHIDDDYPSDIVCVADTKFTDCNDNKHIIEVKSKVVLYASKVCSDMMQEHCRRSGQQTISVIKLTNITSSRRHISAIYNLRKFSKQKSLLMPVDTDPYFRYEDIPNMAAVVLGKFNDDQMRVIAYAEHIFCNKKYDRLHLVHGPPGLVAFLSRISCKI
jgi:hypothetical protein